MEPEVGQCDSVLLSPLSEDAFIHNLHIRFKRDIIYTYIGNVLISVNPYRQLSLYSAELVRAYISRAPFQLPPHVYAVAGTAFRWLRDRNESQCIVVSGESGSGKTEAARISLQCVVLAGEGSAGSASVRERLTQAGTLLEAFGNAKTMRNDNASRFGKYLDIEFDYKGDPIGGHITHYLLEKSRITSLQQGDRNFHVFYQLLTGTDAHLLKLLKLQRSAEAYRILKCPRLPGISNQSSSPHHYTDDRPHFAFTKIALETLGFSNDDIIDIFKIVAVVLKLGNIEFIPSTNIDGTVGCSISQEYEVVESASLLGCSIGVLSGCLCGEMGPQEAYLRRDKLITALYSRLFTWLVGHINNAIKVKNYSKRSSLSILDLYGFEILGNNSLEQLLINYANEKLHYTIIDTTLGAEQEEYIREGLEWQRIPYFDNEPICHLIESTAHGILTILEEPYVLEGGAVELLGRLQQCWAGHSHLLPQPPTQFQLRHFAGTVTYNAAEFVEKNSDILPRGVADVMYQCRHSICKDLFPEGNPSRGPFRRPSTLGWQQRVSLGALQRCLRSRRLHHIRCLRPNDSMRPRIFEIPLVQHQVRYSGMMESVLLWRSGHCASMSFSALATRFAPLLTQSSQTHPYKMTENLINSDPLKVCKLLVRNLPIPPAEFAFGRSRIFLRSPRTVFELEEMRNLKLEGLAVLIQRVWRGFRVRRLLSKKTEAQRVIARAWRRWKTRKRIQSMKQEKRVLWAVQTIQRHYIQWKRWRYLMNFMAQLPLAHLSPLCNSWPRPPPYLASTHHLLRQVHHRWRCHKYRLKFDQTARNRMREKVTASIIFKDRKQSYSRSVSHPFVGDYVRLRQNTVWKRVCIDTDDQYVVFADIVNKVTRSSGKLVPTLAVVSTSAMLLLDQRTLGVKYRIPASEIYRISLSPLPDDIAVFHVRACTLENECYELDSQVSSRASTDTTGCLFGSDISKKKGDFVFQTCHIIEMVTKLFLVVQNAVGKAPDVNISTEFEANFGQQIVTFSFKCYGLPELHPDAVRVIRKGNKMEVHI